MQDACHHKLSKYDLARHESPSSLVVRASDRCTGGYGFDSLGESDFSLSQARDRLIIPSFLMRSVLFVGCYFAVGLEKGQITDSQLRASSSKPFFEPHQARLHLTAGPKGNGAWCAAKSAIGEYLQVKRQS